MGLIALAALAGGGYYVWTNLGGDVSGTAPDVERPDVELPDANEAADKASDGFNSAANTIMGLSDNTWKIILIGLVAAYLAWLWYSRPKFKWSVIGGAIMLVIMIAIIPQFQ